MNKEGNWTQKKARDFIGDTVRRYYRALGRPEKEIKCYVDTMRKGFTKWMGGQTVPVLENGETGYYSWDVKRYIDKMLYGTPTYFD